MNENPIKKGEIMEIYVDGASRGNPGPAACAFVFMKKDEAEIHSGYSFIGDKTNNVAEYTAIINALRAAVKFTRWKIKLFSDSQLVVKQLNKEYRIKADHLFDLCVQVYSLCDKFSDVKFFYVNRDHPIIEKCDSLCNKCLDERRFKK